MDDEFRTAMGVMAVIAFVLGVVTMTFSLFYMTLQGMCGALFLGAVAYFLWRMSGFPIFPPK